MSVMMTFSLRDISSDHLLHQFQQHEATVKKENEKQSTCPIEFVFLSELSFYISCNEML